MATQLLNDDGTASMATIIMSSHHAFRRDLACFAARLSDDRADAAVLKDEWAWFRGALHSHHASEDTGLFPDLRARFPELADAIDELDGHHRAIDPLLERGDHVFADLTANLASARNLIAELSRHLTTHLDAEERSVIPHLRDAKQFLAPVDDQKLLAMYAGGFAWSCTGLAPNVFAQICAMLPAPLTAKLPAARQAFDARCVRVWGYVHGDVSVTSVPAGLSQPTTHAGGDPHLPIAS